MAVSRKILILAYKKGGFVFESSLFYLIISNTRKPLEELSRDMKCFCKGEKVKTLEIKTKDEVGYLTMEANNSLLICRKYYKQCGNIK